MSLYLGLCLKPGLENEREVMSRIRVGIIGVGAIGTVHAEAYKASADCELKALCDVRTEALTAAAKKFGVTETYTDYREMLKNADIDAVSVCVGNVWHKECAVAAFAAGKHVLLEKPMAMNGAEAAEIVEAERRSGKIGQMGMVWRQNPQAQIVRDYIEQGLLGDIYHMRVVYIRRRGIPGLGGWFTTKAQSGGGPIIDVGVHFIDLLLYLSGLWNISAVSAATYAKFGQPMDKYNYVDMWAGPPKYDGICDTEDYASGTVRFGKQATLNFEIAWAANTKEQLVLELLGDKGGVRLCGEGEQLTFYTEHGGKIVDICPKFSEVSNGFHLETQAFLDAINGKRPPAATMEQGVRLMQLLDAIYLSSERGEEVKL